MEDRTQTLKPSQCWYRGSLVKIKMLYYVFSGNCNYITLLLYQSWPLQNSFSTEQAIHPRRQAAFNLSILDTRQSAYTTTWQQSTSCSRITNILQPDGGSPQKKTSLVSTWQCFIPLQAGAIQILWIALNILRSRFIVLPNFYQYYQNSSIFDLVFSTVLQNNF